MVLLQFAIKMSILPTMGYTCVLLQLLYFQCKYIYNLNSQNFSM